MIEINQLIKNSSDKNIEKIHQVFSDPRMKAVIGKITGCLHEDCTNKIKDGGFIRDGFDINLDELRLIQKNGNLFITKLETREKEKTGISNLKIGYSPIQGFFLKLLKVRKIKFLQIMFESKHLKTLRGFLPLSLMNLGKQYCKQKKSLLSERKRSF